MCDSAGHTCPVNGIHYEKVFFIQCTRDIYAPVCRLSLLKIMFHAPFLECFTPPITISWGLNVSRETLSCVLLTDRVKKQGMFHVKHSLFSISLIQFYNIILYCKNSSLSSIIYINLFKYVRNMIFYSSLTYF